MGLLEVHTALLPHQFKLALHTSIKQSRLRVLGPFLEQVAIVINMTVGDDQIEGPVVVKIDKTCPPAHPG